MERFLLALSLLLVNGVSGDEISVKVGESVNLNSGVEKTPDQVILWYFEGVLIAYINGDPSKTCLYDGVDGMFRNRLHNDTGNLIIKNLAVEHSGLYEANDWSKNTDGKKETLQNNKTQKCNSAKISREKLGNNIKTFTVTVSVDPKESNMETRIQDPTSKTERSSGAITGVCVAVLLLAAAAVAGVIYNQRGSRREYPEKNKKALMTTDEKTIEV